ncbi:MAG: helix-turn-helix transcriptional regulator [Candidatus Latescibacteria bacterium]|nr:helix-turn-helix transcriptional regulator [Candidatus Latescibacterota bacterium]
MKTLKGHLEDKLQHDRFRKLFSEGKQLAQLSMQILEVRQRLGLSQREVAEKAKVTQQQLSNLEHGANCNVSTFLKVCNALGVLVALETPEFVEESVV